MISIDVHYLPPLTELFSKRRENVDVQEGTKLHQLLTEIYAPYLEKLKKDEINPESSYFVIMLNGKIVSNKSLDVELNDNDVIKMWMLAAGG